MFDVPHPRKNTFSRISEAKKYQFELLALRENTQNTSQEYGEMITTITSKISSAVVILYSAGLEIIECHKTLKPNSSQAIKVHFAVNFEKNLEHSGAKAALL